jgi:hypothetical protein
VLTLEQELQTLRPGLGDVASDALIAKERRDVFSIYPELRVCGWLGATALAGAAGIALSNNLDRIGPVALAAGIAIVAAACYAFVTWRRNRASVVDDYVLLLGALLVSADIAFIEAQFHLFDEHWKRHLLVLAVIHGLGAYAFGSRMLLSLSITALASWLGAGRDTRPGELAVPAFICAAILIAWREVDRRLRGTRGTEEPRGTGTTPTTENRQPTTSPPPTANRQPPTAFSRTFEHFAATIALTGALTLTFTGDTRVAGALLTIVIAAGVIAWGFRTGVEWFVLYAFVFAVIAVDVLLIDMLDSAVGAAFILVVSMIGAIVGLLALHARFKEHRA